MDALAPPRRLTPEQQALASDPRYLRLAEGIAARFGRRFPPLADEFEAAAPVALCEAAATFDPSMGVSFATHAAARIAGAMKDTGRAWTARGFRRKHGDAPLIGSLAHPIGFDDAGDPTTLGEMIASDDEPIGWEAEYQDELDGLARRLSRGAGQVIRSLYGRADTSTMAAVGRDAGLCEARISQLHFQAIEQLSERFPNHEEIFMNGHARFLTTTRIGPESITPADGEDEPDEAPPVTGHGACPECGTAYGKRRRCYRPTCSLGKPGRVARAAPVPPVPRNGHAKADRLPSLAGLDLAGPKPIDGPQAAGQVRDSQARRELRTMGEILSLAEKLSPVAACRVLAWVMDHVGDGGGRGGP